MPCLAVLLALLLPRGTILLLWLASDWFQGVFDGWIWPVIGFLFAPFTLLWYSAVQNWYGGTWETWHWIVLAIALVADLSPGAGKRKKARDRDD